jgi:pimeloyl-ACP methyl ester carboxylesterase
VNLQRVEHPNAQAGYHLVAGGSGERGRVLLVMPDVPLDPGEAAFAWRSHPALAARLHAECGWAAAAGCLRGLEPVGGAFSARGWLDDARALVQALREAEGFESVWVAGFGLGGTVAIAAAADDPAIGGVACLAAPAQASRIWPNHAHALEVLQASGALGGGGEVGDPTAWWEELCSLDARRDGRQVVGRPVLVVHGTADELVAVDDARAIAEATRGELRLVPAAGHRLRADPRAIASLIGWLERHRGGQGAT